MRHLKKIASLMLSAVMLFSLAAPSASAIVPDENIEAKPSVDPVTYQAVASEIIKAKNETVVQQAGENYHYYWDENSFIVKDSSGYYFVEINEDFTKFFVNGKAFEITTRNANNSNGITYPTSWVTSIDAERTFDVGGIPASVAGGMLASAITSGLAVFTGGLSAWVKVIVENFVSAVAGVVIDGLLPIDFLVTVHYLMKYRIIEPALPTIIEYYSSVTIYSGTSKDLYKDVLVFDDRTYQEVSYAD